MGCCNPNYRKIVQEQEEQINQQENDTLSAWQKISIIAVTTSIVIIVLFL